MSGFPWREKAGERKRKLRGEGEKEGRGKDNEERKMRESMIWPQGSPALRIPAEEENPTKETKRSGQWSKEETVVQSCLTLYDSVDCSKPGFPVLHHLPEFAQICVH